MPKDVGFLIAPIKNQDSRLYDILFEISAQLKTLQSDLGVVNSLAKWSAVNFELPSLVVANDIMPTRYTFVLPKSRGNDVGLYWRLKYLLLTSKIAPTATDFIVDILQSQDRGLNFRSIFPIGDANKAVLNVDLTLKKQTLFSVDQVHEWDMLRIDVVQTDVDVDGVSLKLGLELITE